MSKHVLWALSLLCIGVACRKERPPKHVPEALDTDSGLTGDDAGVANDAGTDDSSTDSGDDCRPCPPQCEKCDDLRHGHHGPSSSGSGGLSSGSMCCRTEKNPGGGTRGSCRTVPDVIRDSGH